MFKSFILSQTESNNQRKSQVSVTECPPQDGNMRDDNMGT